MNSNTTLFRRRREGVTDYKSRKKAILSQGCLLVVRASGKNVSGQFLTPKVGGDLTLVSVHSRNLQKLGWKGSGKSTPACYLLGLLAGKKALAKGITEAFLYNGLRPFIRGSRVTAFAKGVKEAGVNLSISEEVFPNDDRLNGKTIAEYASKLLKESKESYNKKFSSMIKAGFKPEDYAKHVEEAKAKIGLEKN
jgi:large subunit ribosomal protein L18